MYIYIYVYFTGKRSKEHGNPDLVPSIFAHKKQSDRKNCNDLKRYQRLVTRRKLKQQVATQKLIIEIDKAPTENLDELQLLKRMYDMTYI